MKNVPLLPISTFKNNEIVGYFYPVSSNSDVQWYQNLKTHKKYKRMKTNPGVWSEWVELTE